jgi:hypothetical protein
MSLEISADTISAINMRKYIDVHWAEMGYLEYFTTISLFYDTTDALCSQSKRESSPTCKTSKDSIDRDAMREDHIRGMEYNFSEELLQQYQNIYFYMFKKSPLSFDGKELELYIYESLLEKTLTSTLDDPKRARIIADKFIEHIDSIIFPGETFENLFLKPLLRERIIAYSHYLSNPLIDFYEFLKLPDEFRPVFLPIIGGDKFNRIQRGIYRFTINDIRKPTNLLVG